MIFACFWVVCAPSAQAQPATDALDWEFRQENYIRIVPHDNSLWTPVLWADHGLLHLEARFNYEDVDLASVFGGLHLVGGSDVTYDVHLMAGLSFGWTTGLVPAYRFEIDWWQLDLCSEGEVFLDLSTEDNDFVYSWSELGWSPLDHLRGGIALQNTRLYQVSRDVEVGPFLGTDMWLIDATFYVFSLGTDETNYTIIVGISF